MLMTAVRIGNFRWPEPRVTPLRMDVTSEDQIQAAAA